uniref:Putative spliceosomal protein snrnp-u1a/u2b n=1 Tax=Amblyomma aureolatum TaxID=187763 RepID=A0A1E1XF06_9ACAR
MNCNSSYCEDEPAEKCAGKRQRTETEPERLLKEMLTKQLDTRFSVKHLAEQQKHFTAAGNHLELSYAGTRSLNEYKADDSQEREKHALIQCGLTSEEVELYLQSKDTTTMKKKHPLMDPSFLNSKMEEIGWKIRNSKNSANEQLIDNFQEELCRGNLKLSSNMSQSEEIACDESPVKAALKDPMSHIADFSQRLMERVMSKRKKKRKMEPEISSNTHDKQHAPDESGGSTDDGAPHPDPMIYHVIVPIPENEIAAERLGLDEIKKLPRFQNYSLGNKSQVLYLKNLHHKVDIRELMALFCRFDEETCRVKYRLLSGKLRGQAFITFPSVEAATRALELCNGYVLRGKPIIIEYGRNET